MPPKKNLTKKKVLKSVLKPLIKCGVTPIINGCKVNNYLLNYENKLPYNLHEKRSCTSKS